MTQPSGVVTLSEQELAGDLPMVCALTGRADAHPTPVWFARSPWWSWVPFGLLLAVAALRTSWAPLVSWWTVAAVAVPVVASRGVTGRIPLCEELRARRAALRRRRVTTMFSALMLTWVAVGLWLVGSRAGGMVVLAAVVALYAWSVAMFVAGRLLGVRGWPETDGGATLTHAHPDFVTAVELRRTGHRP